MPAVPLFLVRYRLSSPCDLTTTFSFLDEKSALHNPAERTFIYSQTRGMAGIRVCPRLHFTELFPTFPTCCSAPYGSLLGPKFSMSLQRQSISCWWSAFSNQTTDVVALGTGLVLPPELYISIPRRLYQLVKVLLLNPPTFLSTLQGR